MDHLNRTEFFAEPNSQRFFGGLVYNFRFISSGSSFPSFASVKLFVGTVGTRQNHPDQPIGQFHFDETRSLESMDLNGRTDNYPAQLVGFLKKYVLSLTEENEENEEFCRAPTGEYLTNG